MEKLILNDGTELEKSHAHEDTNVNMLFVYTENNYTMKDVFDLLFDQEKAKKIVYNREDGQSATFRGYKRLIDVRDEGGGMITAALRKN